MIFASRRVIALFTIFTFFLQFSSPLLASVDLAQVYDDYARNLSKEALESGKCVQHAGDIYAKFQEAGVNPDRMRIALLVREPNRGMPQPMVPNKEFCRGMPPFWIWHAVCVVDGKIYDPNYKVTGEPTGNYFKNMWGTDPNLNKFWIFSVPKSQLGNIAGSTYPGGPPKMLRYEPISYQEFVKNPSHVTRPKGQGFKARRSKHKACKANFFSKMGIGKTKVRSGFLAKGAKSSTASRVKGSLVRDVQGGIAADVAITLGMSIYDRMKRGGTFREGVGDAVDYVKTPEFYLGDLMGGVLGAALGAAVPIPASIAATGLLGSMAAALPTMAGAMLFARLGASAVHLIREGEFSWKALFASIDAPSLIGQVLGAVIGSTLAAAFLPIPFVGPVIGGLLGAMAGVKIVQWLRGGKGPDFLANMRSSETVADKPGSAAAASASAEIASSYVQAPVVTKSVGDLQSQCVEAYRAFLQADGEARAAALEHYKKLRAQLDAMRADLYK